MFRKLSVLVAVVLFLVPALSRAQVDTLYVSEKHVVHLVCPTRITDVEISNEDMVYVRVMENNENILGLLAFEPFAGDTSLMVVDGSGRVYVYYIVYRSNPGELVRFASSVGRAGGAAAGGQKPVDSSFEALYAAVTEEGEQTLVDRVGEFRRGTVSHVGSSSFGVTVVCDRLFVEGDRIYFRFKVTNRSGLSYAAGNVFFQVERPGGGGGGRVRKTKLQEAKSPVDEEAHLLTEPGETTYSVFVFDKFSLRKSEEFQAFFNEEVDTGTRSFELVFTADDINNAIRKN